TAGYFQAEVTRVDDEVLANSDKVSSGTVEIANGEINSGTVRLSVDDVELTSDKIKDFDEAAGSDLKINSYLDINLNKVLYKGSADDVWSEQIHHLNNKALISLKLEDGVDANNLVIVHNIDDGEEFEIIEIESYDPETNIITFYTDSFSNYALATRTKATNTDDNSKASNESTSKTSNESNSKTSNESNPKTGDNVLFYVSMLGLSIIGLIGAGLYTKKKILK
ncbi:MAG: LPXTG cell wall anchor domain-containing protein, partial [Bacilli bacterium]|nr:LPXTG cell wall anchor domain-containing protein [Bacilli bacterium]